jgi:hypothetical protein
MLLFPSGLLKIDQELYRTARAAGRLFTVFVHRLPLQIRITALPHDRQFEGFDLRRFEPGQAYEVSVRLGQFMIVMGYAQVEMRRFEPDTAADGPRRRRSDGKAR